MQSRASGKKRGTVLISSILLIQNWDQQNCRLQSNSPSACGLSCPWRRWFSTPPPRIKPRTQTATEIRQRVNFLRTWSTCQKNGAVFGGEPGGGLCLRQSLALGELTPARAVCGFPLARPNQQGSQWFYPPSFLTLAADGSLFPFEKPLLSSPSPILGGFRRSCAPGSTPGSGDGPHPRPDPSEPCLPLATVMVQGGSQNAIYTNKNKLRDPEA